MKKSEMLDLVVASSVAIVSELENAGLSKTVIGSVNVELEKIKDLVAPKAGGVVTDVNEVANFDAEGNVTAMLCSLSKRWLPVYDAEGNENFYTDTKSDKFGGFKRLSKAAESIRQKHAKAVKATEASVLTDLLNPEVELTEAQAKEILDTAKVIDYSTVGSETRPVA